MVLRHLIESKVVPVVRLTEVFRQAANSRIIINAHRINEGIMPEFSAKGENRISSSLTGTSRSRLPQPLWKWSNPDPRQIPFDPIRTSRCFAR